MRRTQTRFFAALAALSAALVASCVNAPHAPTPKDTATPIAVTVAPPRNPITQVNIDADDPLLAEIEKQLKHARAQKVVLPVRTLKALIQSHRSLRGQCRTLNDQLKALKNLDLKETGGTP